MNIHRLTMACAALLLTVSAPAWALNKCVGPNGGVVFQDAPCAGQGGAITVNPASGNGSSGQTAASNSVTGAVVAPAAPPATGSSAAQPVVLPAADPPSVQTPNR